MRPLILLVLLATAAAAHSVVRVDGHPCRLTLEPATPILAPPPAGLAFQRGTLRCRGIHALRHVDVAFRMWSDSASGAFVEKMAAGPCQGTDVASGNPYGAAHPVCRSGLITCPGGNTKPFLFCP